MNRTMAAVCMVLVGLAVAGAPAGAADMTVTIRTVIDELGKDDPENPFASPEMGDLPAIRAQLILDWSDPNPGYDTYHVFRALSGDPTGDRTQIATVYDPNTELEIGSPVCVPGDTDEARAQAECKAKIAVIGPEAVGIYEVWTACTKLGYASICTGCDCSQGQATTSSGCSTCGPNEAGASPTGFAISYNSWLTDNYVGWTTSADPDVERPTDLCPGWVHNWDRRLARSPMADGALMYELWLGGSRFVFWEDSDNEFHTDPGVRDFRVDRTGGSGTPIDLDVRYGNRVYTFEGLADDSSLLWTRAVKELKIFHETSTSVDGYYLSYKYDANGRLSELHEGDGTTQDEGTRLLSFTFTDTRLTSVTANTDGSGAESDRTLATLSYGTFGSGATQATMLWTANYYSGGDQISYVYDYDTKYGRLLALETSPSGDAVLWSYADLVNGDDDSRDTQQNWVHYHQRQLKRGGTTTNRLLSETTLSVTTDDGVVVPSQSYRTEKRAVEESGGSPSKWYFTRSYFPYTEENGSTLYTVYRSEAVDGSGAVLWSRATYTGFDGHVAKTLFEGDPLGTPSYEQTTYEYDVRDDGQLNWVKSRTRRTTADPSGAYDSYVSWSYAEGNATPKATISRGPDGVKQVTLYVTVGSEQTEYAQDRVDRTYIEDADGYTTNLATYSYYSSGDAKYKLESVDNACCGTTDYVWNADHTLASVEDELGNKVEYVYSYADSGSFGRPWKVKRPGQEGRTLETVYEYTATGQVDTVTYPPAVVGGAKFVVEYVYDDDGRVSELRRKYGTTTYAYTSRVQYTYAADGSGFLEKIERDTTPNGGSRTWVVAAAYTYDLSGATTGLRNGDGSTGGDSEVQYVYDDYGRLETKRVRTAAGSPGTWIETDYDYYPDGSTWKVTDARDVMVEYTFYDDNAVYSGRLREIDFPSDSSILWSYNSTTGRALRVDQGGQAVLWSYDGFGRLKQLTDVWGKIIHIDTYDASSKITHWRYPGYSSGDVVVYAYDDIGRLVTITDNMPASGTKTTTVDYDQDTGAMVKVTLPNLTVTTLEYDDLGRLTHLVNAKSAGGAVITSYAYHYDEDAISSGLGLVDRIGHEDGRFDTFAYDAHERLTTEHYKAQDATTLYRFDYTYDDDGNRLSKQFDNTANKVVWFSDETDRTTIDTDFDPSNQLKRMWTGSGKTTGTKHTVCGSFTEANIDSVEVVSKTTGDTEVDSVTAQIRDGLFIARALNFFDGSNLATKASATATDKAGNTAADTNTGVEIDTTLDVWYTYDADGRREYKYEAGSYESGDPFTRYYWNQAGYLKQVDIDYGTDESPRYARGWLTWDPTGDLVKLEIRTGSVLDDLTPGSGGTLVYLTKWTYFASSVLVERDEVPGTPEETEYVSIAGAYLYQVDAADAYWYYHYDAGGSIAAITDANKAIRSLYDYDAFGNKLTNAGTVGNEFGFYGGTVLERLVIDYESPSLTDPQVGRPLIIAAPRTQGRMVVLAAIVLAAATISGAAALRRGRHHAMFACLVVMLGADASLILLGILKHAGAVGVDAPGRFPKDEWDREWACCWKKDMLPLWIRAEDESVEACVARLMGTWYGPDWEKRVASYTLGGSAQLKGGGTAVATKLGTTAKGGAGKVLGSAGTYAYVGSFGYTSSGGLFTLWARSKCLQIECANPFAPRRLEYSATVLFFFNSPYWHCFCPEDSVFIPVGKSFKSTADYEAKYPDRARDFPDYAYE